MLGPNITGSHTQTILSGTAAKDFMVYGAFSVDYLLKDAPNNTGNQYRIALGFNASKSNAIYSKSPTVQPQSLILNAIIKY